MVVLVLSMLVAVVLLTLQPLEPLPASGPADEFSAERAFSHVDRIAQRPHPVGSAANTEVREYLVGQLEDLGLRPTVQATTAVQAIPDGTASLARVNNIHARIEGTDSTGHVVLVAHHDSVANSLGAADDGAGVAAVLEISRALTSGPSPRNDVDLVLTDAEEPGLLGAQGFVDAAGTLDPQRSVVLNLEARGTSGPTLMFETNPDNANVVPALASARRPIAGSESAELYRLLPNDTDFTVFSRAGFAGMNFAFVDGSAHYHTLGDSPSNLDPSSLQHMGATVLDVARHLARQDLGAPRGGPLTYSSVFGQLVYYPQGLAVPLAILAAVAFAATVLYARRRGLRARAVAVPAVGFLALLAVTGGLGVAAWQALLLLHPGYGSFLAGDTYRPEWYAAGLLALTAALAVAWYLLMRRRRALEEVAVAIWAWLVVLALITAVFVPGAAHTFTWTTLVGCCALAAAIRWGGADPTWRLACCAAAVPAIVAFLPLVDFSTGLASAAFPMTIAVLVLAIALPVLDLLAPPRAWLVPVAVSVVGLALITAGLRIDTFDARHPRQTSLVYALDADQEQASWLSADPAPAPWTNRYANTERSDTDDRFPANGIFSLPPRYHAGPASVAQLTPPDVTVTRSQQDGDTRDLELRIAPGGASRLAVYADTTAHTLAAVTVDGISVDEAVGQPQGGDPSKWGFLFHTVPSEGIDVTLRVRGEDSLPLRVVAYRDGLPQVPELTPVPDDLTWSAASSNLTMITKTYRV